MAVPFLACMALTASVYHLPPRVLPSIHAIEGGRVGLVHLNKDGSEDLGVMQINTLWIGTLARFTRLPDVNVRDRLLNDPCFNIAAAGLIMRTYLNETKGDLLRAVGDYHSHTPILNLSYQAKVLDAARAMFASRR
jgi:Transglycosylase SLT domain